MLLEYSVSDTFHSVSFSSCYLNAFGFGITNQRFFFILCYRKFPLEMEPEDIETKKYQLFDETIKSYSQASSSLSGSTLLLLPQASVASTSQLVLSSIVVEVAQASVASTSQPVLSSEVVGEASEVVGEASESEEESKKTLNKTIELYLRSFHKFRGLRLEQIRNDNLSPKEEEDQKKRVDDVQKEMVAAIKDVRLKSGNKETLAKNLRDLKKGIQKLEDDCFKINQEKESAEKETAQKKAEKEK